MSELIGAFISRKAARTPVGGGPAATITEAINDLGPVWYHKLQGAASVTGPNLTLVNSPQTGVATLSEDDAGGASTGFDGAATTPMHCTGTNLSTATDFTIFCLYQPDTLTAKHIMLTTGGGSVNGQFSLENNMGAARVWSVVGGVPRIIASAGGVFTQGQAKAVFYIRRSGASPSQEVYVDATQVVEDSTSQAWSAIPAATWYVGAWSDLTFPTDGLLGHMAIFNRALTEAERATLLRAQDVAWAVPVDAGSVNVSQVASISLKGAGWHGRTPIVPAQVTPPSLGSVAVNGELLDYTAGATPGTNDTFTARFTTAGGKISNTITVTIDVAAAASEVTLASVAAFSVTRQRLTTASGWPVGRTPKQIVTQGERVRGYIRRTHDYTPDNDGTYIDLVAGCRRIVTGVNDTIVLQLDNDATINLRIPVSHALPSPRIVLDRSGADVSGTRNYTAWDTAVASLQAGETLVVRAPTGTWNDSAGHAIPLYVYTSTGNPKPTGNNVTIMAHPSDVAEGRMPVVMYDADKYARFVYDTANCWVLHQTLSGGNGTIWRSVDAGFTIPASHAAFYRVEWPRLQGGDCDHNWTVMFSVRQAAVGDRMFVLQDITTNPTSDWNNAAVYRGPSINFHTDGRIYVRLSPPIEKSIQDPASSIAYPPWDWSAWYPDEDPRQVPIWIATGPNGGFTSRNRLVDMEGRSGWQLENIAFFYGTTAIYAQSWTGTGLICRGVYAVGGTSGEFTTTSNDAAGGLPSFMAWTAAGTPTSDIIMDRCCLFGGAPPWGTWHDGKHDYGYQGIPVRRECVSSSQLRIVFRHTWMEGFWQFIWQNSSPWLKPTKLHIIHCALRRWGEDGAVIAETLNNYHITRCRADLCVPSGISGDGGSTEIAQIVNTLFFNAAAWVGTSAGSPAQDIYPQITANNRTGPFFPPSRQIAHGSNAGAREFNCQSLFLGTSSSGTSEIFNSPRQGAGSGMCPEYLGWSQTSYASRIFNNIAVIVPPPSAWPYGRSTAVAVYRTDGGALYNYNHLWRVSGTYPTPAAGGLNGYIIAGNTRTTPAVYATLQALRDAFSVELQGTDGTAGFAGGTPVYPSTDPTAVGAAFDPARYLLAVGSACRTGGNTALSAHGVTDYDINTSVTWAGKTWRGPLAPDVPIVEQRLGILGPPLLDPIA